MSAREQFEAAVITRMKESGFLEVEIRVECLGRSGDGYADGSIDAYWHFWKESRAVVAVVLPPAPAQPEDPRDAIDDSHMDAFHAASRMRSACEKAIEAAGLKVMP
ncbi:hypothetical protein KW846_03905 [Pseudomonas sp. PDM32]|uniref:hypothetical protein n=1 Tax=Pseudomonas sp. PDM32 TaxID=2854768 RepID=UPI001C449AB4|nr:hypothetical protein [Pseudomonas sp. PDM32]MBV7571837.1 hypothetical protein [Pseudomonas sp. PDM32]